MSQIISRRRPNFTPEELIALAEAIRDRRDILFGRFEATAVTRITKSKAWVEVTSIVNAVGGMERTVAEIMHKHKNIKTTAKAKESHNRRERKKTGGGTAEIEELTESQKIILQTISPESVSGVEGGIDFHDDYGISLVLTLLSRF